MLVEWSWFIWSIFFFTAGNNFCYYCSDQCSNKWIAWFVHSISRLWILHFNCFSQNHILWIITQQIWKDYISLKSSLWFNLSCLYIWKHRILLAHMRKSILQKVENSEFDLSWHWNSHKSSHQSDSAFQAHLSCISASSHDAFSAAFNVFRRYL